MPRIGRKSLATRKNLKVHNDDQIINDVQMQCHYLQDEVADWFIITKNEGHRGIP